MPNYASTALERRWIEEVVYLHALWRQGPPRHRPYPNPNPNPKPTPTLRPSKPPAFMKRKRQRGKKKNPPATPDKEWPCPPATAAPDPEASGWTDPPPAAPRPPPSVEEQARAAAAQAQHAAMAACKKFFSNKNGSDDEEEDDDDDDADGVESEVDGFFLVLFKEDGELRGYYERNCEKGGFYCLVCAGIGEKKGRRYPDCVGLVQHANAISKTKRPAAHRALAKAVCRVLAWDIDRLPSIVLDLADPLGKSLADQKEDSSALKPEEVVDDEEADDEDVTSYIEASPRDNAKEDGNAVQ